MTKLNLLILLISSSLQLTAQWTATHTANLEWTQITQHDAEKGTTEISESFDGAILSDIQQPLYHYRFNIPVKGTIKVRMTNVETERSIYNGDQLGNKWDISTKVTTSAGSYYGNVTVLPLRNRDGQVEKLISFTLQISLESKTTSENRGPTFKNSSTLAQGTFYKIAVDKSGAYQITGQQLQDELGINIASINPTKLKMFTGQAAMLPEFVSGDRIDDLMEIPLQLQGMSDGSVSTGDAIQFYADGPDKWEYNAEKATFENSKNIYATKQYLFLQIDGANGLRMQEQTGPAAAEYVSEDYDFLQIHEDDRVNLLGASQSTEGTGQVWYGEYFGATTNMDFSNKFDFSGIRLTEDADITYEMACRSNSTTRTNLRVGSETISRSYSSVPTSSVVQQYARAGNASASFPLGANPTVAVEFLKSNSVDEAWLDYIQIIARRKVALYGGQTFIQDARSLAYGTAAFSANIAAPIWNVTDPALTARVKVSNGRWTYNTNEKVQRFLAVGSFMSPTFEGPVSNQNLHSLEELDMLIIHPTEFTDQATTLADHRAALDGLTVRTIDVNLIYNEFSSGKLDPTAIRDFAKMIHDRTENFRYLLLLGDGSYDYRNVVTGLPDHNFVPAYQTPESLNPISGFPTDDYFALLSDEEGTDLLGDLDIAVGRIPVETAEQADDVINKIIKYDTGEKRFGDWRLKLGFAADDEDGNKHIDDSDAIARDVRQSHPVYNQQKIYFDAFEQISTPGGDRFDDASTTINNNVQSGQLVLNYLGHGGPNGWAQERVLKKSDIDAWQNEDQLPILITATCSFTGYDDPNIVSAGEYALRKADGGVVALYTTTRAVFANSNKALADVIFDNIFNLDDDQPKTLGAIMQVAKNSVTNSGTVINSRKFALIGDPSMRIAIPTQSIATTKINGIAVSELESDTIKALEQVTITGVITNPAGQLLSDFNGTVYPTVYDKASTIETLVNDSDSKKKEFDVFRSILFTGAASVVNGEFSFTFVVPKDINYRYGFGRISYYADNGVDLDAAGYFENIVIGGSGEGIAADDIGPEIQLFMNDESFRDGGLTESNSLLLVHLADDLGINVSGNSIGHDLTAILDGDEKYILNDFYEANPNDHTSGTVRFPLNNLSVGLHTMIVKAWDIANNSAEAEITFEVIENLDGKILNVTAYPNPISGGTEDLHLSFEHDLKDQDLDLEVYFYNSMGQYLTKVNKKISATGNRSVVDLNGFWRNGNDFPQGMYYYKIKLTSSKLDSYRESDFNKLVKTQ